MSNVTNLTRVYSWNVVGNALTDSMLKSCLIITEKEWRNSPHGFSVSYGAVTCKIKKI